MGRDIGKIRPPPAHAMALPPIAAARLHPEMILMLEEGALPEQIDKVMMDFGYPMGPFAVSDLPGSTSVTTRANAARPQNPNYRRLHDHGPSRGDGPHGQKTAPAGIATERRSHADPDPRTKRHR